MSEMFKQMINERVKMIDEIEQWENSILDKFYKRDISPNEYTQRMKSYESTKLILYKEIVDIYKKLNK